MLDDATMRVALGGVSLTVLILFYAGVYRPTRSAFSGWWSVSLLGAGLSTSLLLLNGTEAQPITNPASNVTSVIGVTCVWFATRSLRRRRLPVWMLAVAPPAILVPSLLQNPAENIWAGNGALFMYMAALFAAGSTEVWIAWAARRKRSGDELSREALVALLVTAIASSALALFYLLRAVLYYAVGPHSSLFTTVTGTVPTTGFLLVCLVGVTFSVSALGWDQQTYELRRRAMQDDLTGLLGRTEFRLRTELAFRDARAGGIPPLVIVADLDHFKSVNDDYGHAAGDRALLAFAASLRGALRSGELAGRLGGEEFGLVLLDVDVDEATARLGAMSEDFALRSQSFDFELPTVSYGIAGPDDGESVAEIFERADLALYRAKTDGRNRAVKYTPQVGREAGRGLARRSTDHDSEDDASGAGTRRG